MENKVDLTTWTENKTADKTYGMSYPYISIKLNDVVILEKLPFSPYMGRFNGFSFLIADISTLNNTEFSVQIIHKDNRVGFERELNSLQSAYLWAIEFCQIAIQ